MSTITEPADEPTGSLILSRDAFWEPPIGLCSRLTQALLDAPAPEPSLSLFAPALVDLSQRSTLPVLACLRGEAGAPIGPGAFAAHGVVHVIDPHTGHGGAVSLSGPGSGHLSEQRVPDRFARVVRVELRDRLNLGWRTGQLWVTALLFERASQRAVVKLAFPPRLAGSDFDAFLESQRAKLLPTETSLALLEPEPYRELPELPAEGGLALQLDPVHRVVPGFPLRLYGVFDLPFDSELPPSSAPVRILVLSTADWRFRENVLWAPVAEARAGRVRASFVVDVGALLPPVSSSLPERLFIYAFSGTAFAGPATTTRCGDRLVDSPLG